MDGTSRIRSATKTECQKQDLLPSSVSTQSARTYSIKLWGRSDTHMFSTLICLNGSSGAPLAPRPIQCTSSLSVLSACYRILQASTAKLLQYNANRGLLSETNRVAKAYVIRICSASLSRINCSLTALRGLYL